MTDENNIYQLITELLAAPDGLGEVAAGTSLTDGGLELTSLELVRLLVSLEERLDIEFDDVEIMNAHFDTVDDIVALVRGSLVAS
jgi:acyl carrier protein